MVRRKTGEKKVVGYMGGVKYVCSVFVPVYHVFSWLERDEASLKSGSDI